MLLFCLLCCRLFSSCWCAESVVWSGGARKEREEKEKEEKWTGLVIRQAKKERRTVLLHKLDFDLRYAALFLFFFLFLHWNLEVRQIPRTRGCLLPGLCCAVPAALLVYCTHSATVPRPSSSSSPPASNSIDATESEWEWKDQRRVQV